MPPHRRRGGSDGGDGLIVKPYAARKLLLAVKRRLGLDQVQVAESAVFCLARLLEAQGRAMAESAFAAFREDNDNRERLSIPRLRRLTDEHVEEALDGEH